MNSSYKTLAKYEELELPNDLSSYKEDEPLEIDVFWPITIDIWNSEKRLISQIYFTTCDDDIEEFNHLLEKKSIDPTGYNWALILINYISNNLQIEANKLYADPESGVCCIRTEGIDNFKKLIKGTLMFFEEIKTEI